MRKKKLIEYEVPQESADFEKIGLPLVDSTVYNGREKGVRTLKNNIREIREAKGISIRQLEKMTGISRSTLSKVERGRMELYKGWKDRIEKSLGEIIDDQE